MPSYHFDCGNSSDGPIGFCGRVVAESPHEALRILQEELPESLSVDVDDDRIEYLNVYFGSENVTVTDIDTEDDTDGETSSLSANSV